MNLLKTKGAIVLFWLPDPQMWTTDNTRLDGTVNSALQPAPFILPAGVTQDDGDYFAYDWELHGISFDGDFEIEGEMTSSLKGEGHGSNIAGPVASSVTIPPQPFKFKGKFKGVEHTKYHARSLLLTNDFSMPYIQVEDIIMTFIPMPTFALANRKI